MTTKMTSAEKGSCCGCSSMKPDSSGAELAKDPVCGMTVDPTAAKWSTFFEGQTYFFCNSRCLEKFRAEPRK